MAEPADWKVGDVIADLYEVTGLLGEGGMGKVFKVHHKGWNVDLAVKSPRPQVLGRAGGAANFVRECETWVNLGLHPHSVSCYYVRTLGGVPRVFAEYVEGGSLAEWIRKRRLYEGGPKQALLRILDIAIQFAWGLHYAHEQGLVHQDVKPANVMMTSDGVAKVTDFGLARARGRVAEHTDAASGQSILVASGGMTPAYCSPEQASQQPLSRKTDIWSWGLSVLEMFTGEITWMAGQAARETLQGYVDTGSDDATLPPMPQVIAALLERCFAKDPKDRPQTMQQVARAVQEVHERLSNEPYSRSEPQAAELTADSLNNRALSYLDLENKEQAQAAWEQALATDQQHPESTYNRGLALWREAKLTDDALVAQLEAVRKTHGDSWRAKHLLALVHLERGDVDAALPLLEAARQAAPNEREVQEAIAGARSNDFVPGRCVRKFEGHTAEVNSVCLSADGRLALSGTRDGFRLWDVATGHCIRVFEGEGAERVSVTLSDNAKVALSRDGVKVQIWDVATGRCARTFQVQDGRNWRGYLNVDGRLALWDHAVTIDHRNRDPRLSTREIKTSMQLWDAATGQCLRSIDLEEGETIAAVNFYKSTAITTKPHEWDSVTRQRTDGFTRFWDFATGCCMRTAVAQLDQYTCMNAELSFALSLNDKRTLSIWELASGTRRREFGQHPDEVHSVSLSADARLAVTGGKRTLRLWEVSSGRSLRVLEGHTYGGRYKSEWISSVCFSADGRFALSGSADETLRLWQLPRGNHAPQQLSRIWSSGEASSVDAKVQDLATQAEAAMLVGDFNVALARLREARALPSKERDPRLLACWRRLSLRCARTGLRGAWLERTIKEDTKSDVNSACLSADARVALAGRSGSGDETLQLWEPQTGRCLSDFDGHKDWVFAVSLSADARFALSGHHYSGRLWEVATGRKVCDFGGYISPVNAVCLSADARLALLGGASIGFDLSLWDTATERKLRTFVGESSGPHSVRFSRSGHLAITGSDKTLQLWDVATARCLRAFEGHSSSVRCVVFSADERLALSGSWDNTVRLWEVATGRCLRVFEGHTKYVNSVCLTSDDRFVLSAGYDNSLRVWEVETGRCLRVLEGHTATIRSADVSADASLALTASQDSELRIWHLDWELEACGPADWDEGARPYLETFLNCHTPYAGTLAQDRKPTEEEIQQALTRRGEPSWTEEEFKSLLHTLGCAGYGWLRPEGVRAELNRMAREWKGPPPLPGAS